MQPTDPKQPENIVPAAPQMPPQAPVLQTMPTPFRVPNPRHSPLRMILMVGGGAVFLLLFLIVSSLVLIAYGKLKVGSPQFRASVEYLIVGLPFMPKTPAYVLEQSVLNQPNMKKFTIDMSVAATNKSFAPYFGNGEIDAKVTGPVDITDTKNPAMALRLMLTKQLDMDIVLKKQIAYFRLNEFPPILGIGLSAFGFPESLQKQFVKRWFYYDTSTLETEASKELNAQKKPESLPDRQITDRLTNVILDYKDKIKTTMGSETVDGVETYKVTTVLSKDLIDALEKASYVQSDTDYKQFKPTFSETIPQVTVSYWVDKKQYFIRKLTTSFTIKQPKTGAKYTRSSLHSHNRLAQVNTLPFLPQPDQDIPVTFVMKFSNINQAHTITTPKDAVRFEDFIQHLVDTASDSSGKSDQTVAELYRKSNNTKRKSDVNQYLYALNYYQQDHQGALPKGITSTKKSISKDGADICADLVPTYISSLPVDPNINTGRTIENCQGSYFTGYTISVINGKVIIIAPYAELGETISASQ